MSVDNPYGISRQLQDSRAKAAELGWVVVAEHTDDGITAADRRRVRPGYQRLVADIRAGQLDAVVCWDLDRLTRQPRELEDWADLAEDSGIQVATATGGLVDLVSPGGLMAVGVKGQMSRMEVRQMKLRLTRGLAQRADRGKPHGRVPYGWTAELVEIGRKLDADGNEIVMRRRVGDDQIDPAAAQVIRDTAQRLLAGESFRSILVDLNTRGVPSPGGRAWAPSVLRAVMLRESNCGRRVHRGELVGTVLGRAPILDEDTHDRVVALLTDPSRVTNPGRPPQHLLSNLALCGRCGGTVHLNVGTKADPVKGRTRNLAPGYVCGSCFGVRRAQAPVDAYVSQAIVTRLSQPGAEAALAGPDRSAGVATARQELAALQARLELASDRYASGQWTAGQVDRMNAQVLPQIDALQSRIRAAMPRPELGHMTGLGAAQAWESVGLDVQRLLLSLLCTITLLPAGKGNRPFDPELVRIDWKH